MGNERENDEIHDVPKHNVHEETTHEQANREYENEQKIAYNKLNHE
jgi:hypothetical protein